MFNQPNNLSQQAYAQAVGTAPTGGVVVYQRDPTPQDIYFTVGQFWINQADVNLWYLNKQSNASGVLLSTWELISTSSVLVSLSDTSNTVVDPSSPSSTPPDNIQLVGGSGISVVATRASNLLTITNTASTSAIEFINVDSGVGSPLTGTTINLNSGANFTTGTQANAIAITAPVDNTHGVIAVQLAGSNAGSLTANNFGVSQFDSNMFTVASGFVKIKNGGTTGAVTELIGDDTLAVVPASGTGAITLDGVVVTNATNAKPVFFKKNATSTEELDVQVTTLSTSGSANINNAGLASFDSTIFTVQPSTGFISLIGGLPATLTLTPNSGTIPVGPNGSGTINVLGAGSITTVGSLNTVTVQLTGLTNHAVLVGAGTPTITNVGPTATAGQVLQSQGAAADPAFSTATYPSTTTINNILYSSSNNVVGQLGPFPNGSTIIGNGGVPTVGLITGSGGINVTNGPGTINISGSPSGLTWTLIAASQVTTSTNNGFFCVSPGGALTIPLPLVSMKGDVFAVVLDGSTSWQITQSTGQQIRVSSQQTTATSGTITSTAQGDSIYLVCEVANLRWTALNFVGNLTIA